MIREEYPDGSLVLATYRGYWSGQPGDQRGEDFEVVWQRADRIPRGDGPGDWFEVRGPMFVQTPAGTKVDARPRGPEPWGTVCGLDDPEPYGVDQVRLYTADEVEALLAGSEASR